MAKNSSVRSVSGAAGAARLGELGEGFVDGVVGARPRAVPPHLRLRGSTGRDGVVNL